MISILIPTYNYNAYPLVKELHNQCLKTNITFEIICVDDGSTNELKNNKKILNLKNCFYKVLSNNIGRTAVRNLLANEAKYENLLLMDADVIPKRNDFLATYMKNISPKTDIIFGGISYIEEKPPNNYTLRWKYGTQREAKPVKKRNEMPYLSITSSGFLIKRSLFLKTNTFLGNRYGLDIIFSKNLQNLKTHVKHINNPIIHLGLENNEEFVKKSKKGLKTLVLLTKEKQISEQYRPIQITYFKLKKYHLTKIFSLIIRIFEKPIYKNITSRYPSLFLFDLYRLYFYIKYLKNA